MFSDCHFIDFPKAEDHRGWFHKSFSDEILQKSGLEFQVAESYTSLSRENVLRGMHFQVPPYQHGKMVTVLAGSIFDVVLDLRKKSQTFCEARGVMLTAHSGKSLFIPEGFAHGFLAMAENTIVNYVVSSSYKPQADDGVLWSSLDIQWPVTNPILSERDKQFVPLNDYKSPF